MQILSITPFAGEIVETDNDPWPTYRRYGPENWENLMGESWEPAYSLEADLEAAYQAAKGR